MKLTDIEKQDLVNWVNALKSGKYQQIRNAYSLGNGCHVCALGALFTECAKARGYEYSPHLEQSYANIRSRYGIYPGDITQNFTKHLGLPHGLERLLIEAEVRNQRQMSFDEIAAFVIDYVRQHIDPDFMKSLTLDEYLELEAPKGVTVCV